MHSSMLVGGHSGRPTINRRLSRLVMCRFRYPWTETAPAGTQPPHLYQLVTDSKTPECALSPGTRPVSGMNDTVEDAEKSLTGAPGPEVLLCAPIRVSIRDLPRTAPIRSGGILPLLWTSFSSKTPHRSRFPIYQEFLLTVMVNTAFFHLVFSGYVLTRLQYICLAVWRQDLMTKRIEAI